eukprot:TRINITY_DN8914_c0_g2_i1.p1 TRINITY_DN8914_c0_g2~~TRINITY_DN8914_c0_g2_i1.p1  ORF type:complete len:585 (+),score=152.63 TRINITY_DN8914_c0_g2_i1:101-1855(+)
MSMNGFFGSILLIYAAFSPSLAQLSTDAAAGTFLQPAATSPSAPAAPDAAAAPVTSWPVTQGVANLPAAPSVSQATPAVTASEAAATSAVPVPVMQSTANAPVAPTASQAAPPAATVPMASAIAAVPVPVIQSTPAAPTASQAAPPAATVPMASAIAAVPVPVMQSTPAALTASQAAAPAALASMATAAAAVAEPAATSVAPPAGVASAAAATVGAAAATSVPAVQGSANLPAAPAVSQAALPAAPAASANSGFLAAPVTQAATLPATAAAPTAPALQGGAAAAPEWHSWHPFRIWPELTALEQLLAGITFATMVKTLCMAGNVIVQISPYPQVKRWEMRRDTGETDAAPYVAIAFGGWQWCYYGVFAYFITQRSGFLILVHSNCLGAILGTYYNLVFFMNCKSESMRQSFQKYLAVVTSLVLLQVCALAVIPTERALFMTGLISSFGSFMGAISMLVCVPAVIQSKDSRAIPGPLVLANAASAFVWCICGWMLSDPLIAAPNVVGFSSSSLCLYLKYIYPSSDDAAAAAEGETVKGKLKNIAKRIDELDLQVGKKAFKEGPLETTPLMPPSAAYTSCGTGGTF